MTIVIVCGNKGFNWLHRQNTGQLSWISKEQSYKKFQLAASPEYRSTFPNQFLKPILGKVSIGCIARIPVNKIQVLIWERNKGFQLAASPEYRSTTDFRHPDGCKFQLAASPEYRSTLWIQKEYYWVSIGCIARIPVNFASLVQHTGLRFNWLHRQNTGQLAMNEYDNYVSIGCIARIPVNNHQHEPSFDMKTFQLAASPEYRSTPSPIFSLYFSVSYKRYFPHKKRGRKITVLA